MDEVETVTSSNRPGVSVVRVDVLGTFTGEGPPQNRPGARGVNDGFANIFGFLRVVSTLRVFRRHCPGRRGRLAV